MSTENAPTWRDYTIEPDGEGPGVAVLCRSDDVCMENQPNEIGRYLTLGEAVDWAKKHVAEHAKWDAEIAAEADPAAKVCGMDGCVLPDTHVGFCATGGAR